MLLQAATVKERLKTDRNFIVMTIVKNERVPLKESDEELGKNARCQGDPIPLKKFPTAQQSRPHCAIKSFAPFAVSLGGALVR